MSWIVIVKNGSGSAQWIEDFGILLQDATQVTLTDVANYDEIGGSEQLKDQVTAGNLVINNGTVDLSVADALNYITLENIDNTLETFYTKSELSGGSGNVHWNNITNAPAFGSPYWIEPVEVIALDIASVPVTGGAVDGDFIVDTDDDVIYQLVTGVWTPFLTGGEGTRVINLTDTNESVWELLSGTWTDTESPTGSMAVLVTDDGDGKQAQYVYNDDTSSWVKIADVDWDTGQLEIDVANLQTDVVSLSGAIDVNTGDITNINLDTAFLSGAIDDNSTDITALSGAIDINTGDITNLQTDVTNLSAAIDINITDIDNLQLDTVYLSGAIDDNSTDIISLSADLANNYTEHVALSAQIDINTDNIYTLSAAISGVGADHNTLDEAYNQGGAGAGRSIITNSGSMVLSAGASGYSPLELTPTATMPTLGLQDGQVTMNGGLLYVYDATRAKWLSVQRQFMAFGKRGNTRNQYIDFYVGGLSSNKSGLRLARNATIVSLAGQLDVSNTCTFNIRKNDVVTDLAQLSLAAVIGSQDTTLNVDFVQGDFLQCYFDSSNVKVKSPILMVEIAWRP